MKTRTRNIMALGAIAGLALAATSAQAEVIYQHSFGGSDGVNIFGTGVDVDNNGGSNTWSGTNGVFEANGDVSGSGGVWLPFAPTTGNIYQLSGSIDYSSGDWITLGFAKANPDANFNTVTANPYGTTLVAASITTFDGQGLNGSNGHTGVSGFNDVDIVLDATDASSANWTVAFYLEGALVSGPSTITNSPGFGGGGDLNNIQYVGFSSSGATIGVIDDFALTIIHEPMIVPPTSPADDSTGVYPGTDLVATFSKDIALTATGTITVTDGSESRVVNLDGTADDGDATVLDNVLTITLDTNLTNFNTTYDVLISSDAIVDTAPAMNPFAGTVSGDWNFTTVVEDLTLPTITLKVPDDEDTDIAASTSIVATFSVPVLADTGNITIVDVTGAGADTRTFPVTDARVSFSGSEMTIVPSTNLLPNQTYAIQIAATAVKNYSETNFAGIVAPDVTIWNFETIGPRNLTWDPSGIDGTSDGSGTWLDAGKWWDGSGNVDWINGSPDSAIIGNGGAGGTITLGAVTAGTVLIDNFTGTYTLNGTSLDQSGGITIGATAGTVNLSVPVSGAGGVTKNGPGYLNFREGLKTFTGPLTINGGVVLINNDGSDGAGNLVLNGGVWENYWGYTFKDSLGTGVGEVQILGGASGFSMNGNNGLTVQINDSAGYEVVWGALNEGGNVNATGFFNPSALVLQSQHAQSNSTLTFKNKIDLNGAPRTVAVNKTSVGSGFAQITNIIRNSDTVNPAGLIKTGPGRLILTAANTYDGGTETSEGTLSINGSLADASMVISGGTVNGSGTLTFNVDGGNSDLIDISGGTIDLSALNLVVSEAGSGATQAAYILIDSVDGGSYTGTFTSETIPVGYSVNYDYDGNGTQVALVGGGGAPSYASWSGGAAANADANNDGVSNGAAWALGAADVNANAISLLPISDNTSDATYFLFDYNRSDEAEADPSTTITVEYSTDMVNWTTAVDDTDNVIINVVDGTPNDAVEVKLKRSTLGASGKLFARLNVVIAPILIP